METGGRVWGEGFCVKEEVVFMREGLGGGGVGRVGGEGEGR